MIYIYIYIEREICVYIYTHMHICTYVHGMYPSTCIRCQACCYVLRNFYGLITPCMDQTHGNWFAMRGPNLGFLDVSTWLCMYTVLNVESDSAVRNCHIHQETIKNGSQHPKTICMLIRSSGYMMIRTLQHVLRLCFLYMVGMRGFIFVT